MNRVTILLESVPNNNRCKEIADKLVAEHFGSVKSIWTISYRLPDDLPLYLVDQFEAEIRERRYEKPVFLLVYGSAPVEDGRNSHVQ